MPQRTHGPTTAAARRNPSSPGREPRPSKSGKTGKNTSASPDQDTAQDTAQDTGQGIAAEPGASPLAPETIARTLRAVADALERDPALARRVAADAGLAARAEASTQAPSTSPDGSPVAAAAPHQRVFHPRLVTGPDATLGPGIPDPFALRAARGEVGLCAVLEDLRLGTLRAMIRAHHLDPSGRFARQNDAARLRALIVEATNQTAGRQPRE